MARQPAGTGSKALGNVQGPATDSPTDDAEPAADSAGRTGRRDSANPVPQPRRPPEPAVGTALRPKGIDRKLWQKLGDGRMRIDGRLDLHGLTQVEAHAALSHFLLRKQKDGARCVLVITGLGRGGDGVLRQMVPRWMQEPEMARSVLAFNAAALKHGGAGALYVLLRRKSL